jgi:hypothetical protein
MLSVIVLKCLVLILIVIMLSVVLLSVVLPSVVAPLLLVQYQQWRKSFITPALGSCQGRKTGEILNFYICQ